MIGKSIFNASELDFLQNSRVGHISTVNPKDDYPHTVPICFVFDDNSFYTSLHKNAKRLNNLNKRNQISLTIDQYKEDRGEWLILKGILIKVEASIFNYVEHSNEFMKGWKLLIKKYPQYKQWANDDLIPKDPEVRRIMQMHSTHKISWGFQ